MISKIYVAYDLYDKDKEKIMGLFVRTLNKYDSNIIFHETEYLHSTIAFVGETDTKNAIELKKQLKSIDISNIDLEISGKLMILCNKPKYYLTLEINNNDELTSIYKKVVDSINEVGVETINQNYLPHISLGRFVYSATINDDVVQTNITFKVKPKAINVFKSVDYAKKI